MGLATRSRCTDLKSQIEDVALDNVSVFENGLIGLTGRIIWIPPVESDDVQLWLRFVRRGTEHSNDVFCPLNPAHGDDSQFSAHIDLRQYRIHQKDVLDVYAVISNSTDESIVRLSWPQANLPWTAYPTKYGNLSLKRNNMKVIDA